MELLKSYMSLLIHPMTCRLTLNRLKKSDDQTFKISNNQTFASIEGRTTCSWVSQSWHTLVGLWYKLLTRVIFKYYILSWLIKFHIIVFTFDLNNFDNFSFSTETTEFLINFSDDKSFTQWDGLLSLQQQPTHVQTNIFASKVTKKLGRSATVYKNIMYSQNGLNFCRVVGWICLCPSSSCNKHFCLSKQVTKLDCLHLLDTHVLL